MLPYQQVIVQRIKYKNLENAKEKSINSGRIFDQCSTFVPQEIP
jgi:hypothetical protein